MWLILNIGSISLFLVKIRVTEYGKEEAGARRRAS